MTALAEIRENLERGIIPFWLTKGIDREFGGYLTCFDEAGNPTGDTDKYIVTQTRMIWGLAAMYEEYPDEALRDAAKQGWEFFKKYFWDPKNGGWYWKVARDGTMLDDGKVVYGEGFAIYALAMYGRVFGDAEAISYAERTFDLLQIYCADTMNGGYFENLEPDFTISAPGFAAGDRKSLDIHMHLMEAFTALYEATGKEIHARKLKECMDLILTHMVNHEHGCALNQFDIRWNPIPAINIRRTWNAERATGEVIETPTDTTSYGHNVELGWLLTRAADRLGMPADTYNEIIKKFGDHSLKFGFDHDLGGVYRDGVHNGPALVFDKEWWQNCEVLVGYLDTYARTGDAKYFDAFEKTWQFDKANFISPVTGEWRQLLKQDGTPLVTDIGNPWKAIYHTGRAMLECKRRLEAILQNA
ncbi:MAG: N-acylglucosamine 2-epimerase [Ruminococcaceae bacterium]|nr:N-acylglucosamine 2-epimerase [Oscillospiraceae bacterium]